MPLIMSFSPLFRHFHLLIFAMLFISGLYFAIIDIFTPASFHFRQPLLPFHHAAFFSFLRADMHTISLLLPPPLSSLYFLSHFFDGCLNISLRVFFFSSLSSSSAFHRLFISFDFLRLRQRLHFADFATFATLRASSAAAADFIAERRFIFLIHFSSFSFIFASIQLAPFSLCFSSLRLLRYFDFAVSSPPPLRHSSPFSLIFFQLRHLPLRHCFAAISPDRRYFRRLPLFSGADFSFFFLLIADFAADTPISTLHIFSATLIFHCRFHFRLHFHFRCVFRYFRHYFRWPPLVTFSFVSRFIAVSCPPLIFLHTAAIFRYFFHTPAYARFSPLLFRFGFRSPPLFASPFRLISFQPDFR
jgi:hypothetical protein